MIRLLFGPAFSLLGLGAATLLVGPDLLTGTRGEPLTVAAPSAVQHASFDGKGCAQPRTIQFGDAADVARIVTLAVRYGADGSTLTIEKNAPAADADALLVLLLDGKGRIVAVTEEPRCLSVPAHSGSAGI